METKMEAKFMGGKSKRAVLAGLSALLLASTAAQASGVGTTGAQFLKVGVGARPLAMGGAYTALPDDANAINWNPGALGGIRQKNLTASYNSLFKDQTQGFLAFAMPSAQGIGSFGAGVNYLSVSKIDKRAGDTEDPDSTFSNQNFALIGSYGRNTQWEGLSIGGNLKYIRETLDSFTGNSVAIDIGAHYKTSIPNLAAGLVVQNLGTKIGPDPLPMTIRGGAAYHMLERKLALASDLEWLAVDKRAYWDLGAEFWAHRALAVRAGYQLGRGQDQLDSSLVGAAFGLGFKLDRFGLDYAFVPFGNLGDTHRVTLGWKF